MVKIWDARTGVELLTLQGHTDMVHSLDFSPDGTHLASGSSDRTAKVWDARTGVELLTLQGHTDMVLSLAFSPDGARLASGSLDQTVKVWDARTGVELLTLQGHTCSVLNLAFSPDDAILVSTDHRGKQLAWDARSGERLREVPRWLSQPDAAHTPDRRYFGWLEGNVVIVIYLRLSDEELAYRRRVTETEPSWHAAEALRFEQAREWFAAAMHLKYCLAEESDSGGLPVRRLRAATLAGLSDPKLLEEALRKRAGLASDPEELRLARAYQRLSVDATALRVQHVAACVTGPRLSPALLDWPTLLEQDLRRQEYEHMLVWYRLTPHESTPSSKARPATGLPSPKQKPKETPGKANPGGKQ
jgi:WD40 repeat protein